MNNTMNHFRSEPNGAGPSKDAGGRYPDLYQETTLSASKSNVEAAAQRRWQEQEHQPLNSSIERHGDGAFGNYQIMTGATQ